MNIEKNKIDLVEDYLMGNLEGTVKSDFEKLLTEDEELQEYMEEFKLIFEGARFSGRKDLFNQLKEIEKNREDKPTKVVKFRSLYYGIAASILLLISTYFAFNYISQDPPSVVAESYFEPYPALYGAATRSSETEYTQLELGMQLYEVARYEESIEILESVVDPEKQEMINFYLGNAYLAIDDYSKSETIFKELINTGKIFSHDAKWYLAITYLKENETDKAISLLKDLTSYENDYAKKAKKMLRDVD